MDGFSEERELLSVPLKMLHLGRVDCLHTPHYATVEEGLEEGNLEEGINYLQCAASNGWEMLATSWKANMHRLSYIVINIPQSL